MAIDVARFMPVEEFTARVEQLVQIMKSTPAAPGFDEVLVAGDPEWRMEAERRVNGLPIADGNWDMLVKAAAQGEGPGHPGTIRVSAGFHFSQARTSEVAARARAGRRELSRSEGPDRAAAPAHGVRKRGLPQRRRVLESSHRDVHDAGQRVHAPLRLLRRAERRAAAGGLRRAAPRRRGGRGDGAEVRGDHQRQSRRSAGWRRGVVRDGDPRHPGARAGLRRRGADSGFPGQSATRWRR